MISAIGSIPSNIDIVKGIDLDRERQASQLREEGLESYLRELDEIGSFDFLLGGIAWSFVKGSADKYYYDRASENPLGIPINPFDVIAHIDLMPLGSQQKIEGTELGVKISFLRDMDVFIQLLEDEAIPLPKLIYTYTNLPMARSLVRNLDFEARGVRNEDGSIAGCKVWSNPKRLVELRDQIANRMAYYEQKLSGG